MLKLTLTHLNNARNQNPTAFKAIVEKMQDTILSGDYIEILEEDQLIKIQRGRELDEFLLRLS